MQVDPQISQKLDGVRCCVCKAQPQLDNQINSRAIVLHMCRAKDATTQPHNFRPCEISQQSKDSETIFIDAKVASISSKGTCSCSALEVDPQEGASRRRDMDETLGSSWHSLVREVNTVSAAPVQS